MLPRSLLLRVAAPALTLVLAGGLGATGLTGARDGAAEGAVAGSGPRPAAAYGSPEGEVVSVGAAAATERRAAARAGARTKPTRDPRRTGRLFVDRRSAAYQRGGSYRTAIGARPQALWLLPEAHPTGRVAAVVRGHARRAARARRAPVFAVYGVPGRDCGQHSSGNPLTTPAAYRAWIGQVARGLRGQPAVVVLEPDAVALFSGSAAACPTKPRGWAAMLRFASKRLSRTGAWVYLDAGHSAWTPYDGRASALKAAGVRYARGISTNVSNFRPTADEQRYATGLLRDLRRLGVRGKRYVVDTSRNGAATPITGDVFNPTWARLGARPRLAPRGAFDGTLWVKRPGESDAAVNGGPPAGHWCDLLADRLLGRPDRGQGC